MSEPIDNRPGTDRAPTVVSTGATVERLTVAEAAARLGLSTDAIRSRLNRGTLGGHKEAGGWVVLLPRPPETVNQPSTTVGDRSSTGQQPEADLASEAAYEALVESQRSEIAFLRRELETRTEELERRDVLLREALQRIPQHAALPAGDEHRAPVRKAEAAASTDEPSTGFRAWWRRLFGGT